MAPAVSLPNAQQIMIAAREVLELVAWPALKGLASEMNASTVCKKLVLPTATKGARVV